MPIYEYLCEDCQRGFEQLVVREEEVRCPECQSVKLSKQYSRFGMPAGSDKTYESLPQYKGPGCGCTPSTCGCKN